MYSVEMEIRPKQFVGKIITHAKKVFQHNQKKKNN